jgi:HEAT repeats
LRIAAAIRGLGEIGPPAVSPIPALIAAYNKALDTDTMAVAGAPAALDQIAPSSAAAPDAVAALMRSLHSEVPSLRLGAVEALGHFGTDALAAVSKLLALQKDSDLSTRATAAKSLSALAK